MTYAIACLLEGPVAEYQRGLIREIAGRFGLPFTLEQEIPPHFTLKYEFETEDVGPVVEIIERFCGTHSRTPVEIGGFGDFPPDVAFLDVRLSPEARVVFEEFLGELRQIRWMTWNRYDGEHLRFHATLAERCGPKLPEVRAFLQGRELTFPCWFDNIGLGVQTGVVNGITRWAMHRCFRMS